MQLLFKTNAVSNQNRAFVTNPTRLHDAHEAGTQLIGTNSKRLYAYQAAFISNLQQLKRNSFQKY